MTRALGNPRPRRPCSARRKKARPGHHRIRRSLRGGSILCIWPRSGRFGRNLGSPSRVGTNWLCATARVITRFLRRMPLSVNVNAPKSRAAPRTLARCNTCRESEPRICTRDNTRYYLKAHSLPLVPSHSSFLPSLSCLTGSPSLPNVRSRLLLV